jgi:NAD(P)H-hydrate repair Nnr-like enzyme with NAD(P)H-hydrate epimerase domain
MGAYEFIPVTLTPKTLNFGLQAVGSTSTKTVTLTNALNKSLNIASKTVPTGYKVSGCGTSVAAFGSCSLTVTFHPLTTGSFKGEMTVKDNAGNSPEAVSLSGTAN